MDSYWAIKKNEILPFAATWIDLENTVLSETEKYKCYFTCRWNIKKEYKWTYIQNRNILRDTENKLITTEEEEGTELN